MKKLSNKRPKSKNENIIINVNGENINLGKLAILNANQCSVTGKIIPSIKCINTGKTFNDIEIFANHISNLLIKNKKIVLK